MRAQHSVSNSRPSPSRRDSDAIYRDRVLAAQRLSAAFLAISNLLLADNLAALAGPPFFPPSLPRATAAGFFSGAFSASDVTSSTMDLASWFTSLGRLLERSGIRLIIRSPVGTSSPTRSRRQTSHVPDCNWAAPVKHRGATSVTRSSRVHGRWWPCQQPPSLGWAGGDRRQRTSMVAAGTRRSSRGFKAGDDN